MPVQLSTYRLLSWLIGLLATYWAVGVLVDSLWYSVVVSACLLVGGAMVAARAVPDAVSIIRRDDIGPGELAVIALALLSVGAVWSGAFNMIYAYHGRPMSWIGATSSFGRAMIAVGFFMFFLSPEATRQGVKWPRWYILLAAAIFIAAVAFIIGYTIRDADGQSALFDTTRGTPHYDLLMLRST
ncbi:hypothetical protein MAUB1S_11484 [Mycolicibacterium aubagnense]